MPRTQLMGIIISDAMDKTRVVQVESLREHSKYKRRYKSHAKFKAHDADNQYHVGEKVVIEESKPLSRDKRWVIVKKI